MLNQTVLVGRLVKNPEVTITENEKKVSNITLAVPRTYKNENGEYDTDFVNCVLWGPIAENTAEYCQKGDLLGIKGRVQTRDYEDKDGNKKYVTEIVAEKVTFLSSKSKDIEDEMESKSTDKEKNKNSKKNKDKEIA